MNAFEQYAARQKAAKPAPATLTKYIPNSGSHLTAEYKQYVRKLTLEGKGREETVAIAGVSRRAVDKIRAALRKEGIWP